jgi:hypothetical protein
MLLELDEREVEALSVALDIRLNELARELSRTEQRNLQHELAQLVTRLELIAGRVRELRRRPATPLVASPR